MSTMRQVILSGGEAILAEVPVPEAGPGRVLVRTAWSVLSPGTERAALRSGETPGLWRAAADPSRLRRALEVLRDDGPAGLIAKVRQRTSASEVAPGYAAAGIVRAAGPGIVDLAPGVAVACAGAGYASHAEWIAVPRHLAVPVPAGVSLDEAAFATLGAIALQGVRRAGLQIGECAVVLGLGLLGHLGAQILRAGGVHVLGYDLDPARAERLRALGIEALSLASHDPLDEVPRATSGLLADAVLIYAATSSSEVVNLAMRLCRRRGVVVVVGDVGLQIERGLMYEKELDLRMSTSYGPGRYDPRYEEQGIDYPAAHVRWTENRNMGAFLELVRSGLVRIRPLIDRVFPLEKAGEAYAVLHRDAGERPLGMLLRYTGADQEQGGGPVRDERPHPPAGPRSAGAPGGAWPYFDPLARGEPIGVAVCGTGAFVRSVHLPVLRRTPEFTLRAVAATTALRARDAARHFAIPRAAGGMSDLLALPDAPLVLIGTRHQLHAAQVREALAAGRHVFVEKPLCLREADLPDLLDEARRRRRLLAVGFNRRYSPLGARVREVLGRLTGPMLALYRVNAGRLPPDSWVQDPEQGGGRILGECCHFLDLLLWLAGEEPEAIDAVPVPSDGCGVVGCDSFAATLKFPSGSRAVLVYTGLGDPGLSKERLEVYRGGAALVLDDFRRLQVFGAPGGSLELPAQDKGFAAQWRAVAAALRGEPSSLIRLEEIDAAMRATFRLERAVRGSR